MKANLGPFAAADEDLVAGALPLGATGALLLGADDEDLLAAALPLGAAGAVGCLLAGAAADVALLAGAGLAADVVLLAGTGLAADVALLDDPPALAAAEVAVLAGAGVLLLSGG